MLNYICAECYRVSRQKGLYCALAVLLVLELLLEVLLFAEGGGALMFSDLVDLMAPTMITGVFMAIVCDGLVFSDQYKTGTLKNEIAFGIPRSRIYLGKLCAALLVALAFCGGAFLSYLGGGWLLAQHGEQVRELLHLWDLACVAAASFPLWLGTLALAHCIFFGIRNMALGVASLLLFLTLGGFFLEILGQLNPLGPLCRVFSALAEAIPTTAFFARIASGGIEDSLNGALMAKNWAVGLGWFLASTAAGLLIFRRREL